MITLCCLTLSAQQRRNVVGRVVDENNAPLTGVTVVVKNGSQGAVTNSDGKYTLKINDSTPITLVYNFFGKKPIEMRVGNKGVINITMVDDNQQIEEVMVIGYGTVRKKEMTGAAVQIDSDQFDKTISSDLGTALQGLVPGVSISASSGDPGASANIQIRGVTSLSGGNTPLYVVDGVPQEGDPMLSVNEIDQIDILKDAASCAIYGTRGAAGVILITTKQGQAGKLKVDFAATYGVQQINISKLPSLMNAEEQAYYQVMSKNLDGFGELDGLSDMNKQAGYYLNDNNIFDLLISNFAPVQNYSISLSGGSKSLAFSAMGGYYNQQGVLPNSSYDRFNFRSNISYKGDRLTMLLSPSIMYSRKSDANSSSLSSAIKVKPYLATISADELDSIDSYTLPEGSVYSDISRIQSLLESLTRNSNTNILTTALNMGADYKITNALNFTSKFGFKGVTSKNNRYQPAVTIYEDNTGDILAGGNEDSYYRSQFLETYSISASAGFNYNKTWNRDHKLTAVGIYSYEQYIREGFYAMKEEVVVDGINGVSAGGSNPSAASLEGYNNKLIGVIGRVMYSYKSRYIMSVSARADASSKFSSENRWAMFPSVSLGWNISDEKFFKPLSPVVSSMKLRLSRGTTGNQSIPSYSYSPYLVNGYDYVDGNGDIVYGLTSTTYANRDAMWETSIQYNAGLDISFLKNKFLLTLDYYSTEKHDMLAAIQLPASVGAGTSSNSIIFRNIGNMTNKGVEANLAYRYSKNGLRLNASLNAAHNKNIVTSLGNDANMIYNSSSTICSDNNSVITAFAVGYEAGAFFLYKSAGVANDETKLNAYKILKPDAQLGDMMYVDTSGDGILDSDDRVYCGSGLPDVELGFNLSMNYKGFDLTTNWFASIGNEAINGAMINAYESERASGLLNMWTATNPTSEVPAFRGGGDDHMNYIGYSDVWVEDGSYLRLNLLSLGYTLPNKMWKSLPRSSSIRLYLSVQNLWTVTGYSGMDPDLGGDGLTTRGLDKARYPSPRTYTVGVNLKL